MARYDDDWGRRRPNTRARRRKPYNDDYKEDDRRRASGRSGYDGEERRDSRYEDSRDPREDRYAGDRAPRRAAAAERERSAEGQPGNGRRQEEPDRRSGEGGKAARRRREKSGRGGIGCLIPLVVLVVLIIGLGAAGFGLAGRLWSRVDSADFRTSEISVNADLPDSVKKAAKDYRTIMVFGVDSRDNTTLQSGALSDSNIIVAINRKTGAAKLLSVYRDTYVETTGGEHMKLTEVYNKYGAKEQLSTINRNFDMNVSEYVTVNWKTVADTINELGGIDLDLSEDECRGINKFIDEVMESTGLSSEHVDVEDGIQHVDGVQAVTYCRLRKGLGDDYKRTERQRTVIAKTLSAAKSAGMGKAMAICEKVFPGLSSSMSLMDVLTLAIGMGNFEIKDSAGFPFHQESEDGGRYYIFPVTLASNAAELHEYLYGNTDYTPSETVQGISRAIEEYSGFSE